MWKTNITNHSPGTWRSLAGYSAEQAFIARAMKAGFPLFFKVWRDQEYDAVLDCRGSLFRIEVKGSSNSSFDFSRGGRSGQQIDRKAENRKRVLSKSDCDFVVGINTENFDCYIIPIEVVTIINKYRGEKTHNYSTTYLNKFKERWDLFFGGDKLQIGSKEVLKGMLNNEKSNEYANKLKLEIKTPYKVPGFRGVSIKNLSEIQALKIWEFL